MAVRRALLFTSVERYLNLAINFLVIAVTSRLMTPDEVGMSVIGLTVLMIIEILRDVPSSFLVQQKELKREDVRTAFTTMALISAAQVIGLTALSGPIARAFNNPELAPYLCVIALATIPGPFERPVMALLRRDMKFGALAVVNVATYLVNGIVVVTLVALGNSYMSTGWACLAANMTSVVLALCFRPDFWIFRPLMTEWRRVIVFGGYLNAWALLNKAYDLVPYLVLSRIFPVGAVGLFNRAATISAVPDKLMFQSISPVILPALAVEARAGRDLKQPYLIGLTYITVLLWPAFLLLVLMAQPAVYILFGPQWNEIVPLVRIIALAMLLSFTQKLNYPTLVALGATRDLLASGAVAVPVGLVATSAAAFTSLQAVAWSLVFKNVVQTVVEHRFVRRHIDFSMADLCGALWRSLLVTLGTMAGPAAIMFAMGSRSEVTIPEAICLLGAASLCWTAAVWLTRHPLRQDMHQAGLWAVARVAPGWRKAFRPAVLRSAAGK